MLPAVDKLSWLPVKQKRVVLEQTPCLSFKAVPGVAMVGPIPHLKENRSAEHAPWHREADPAHLVLSSAWLPAGTGLLSGGCAGDGALAPVVPVLDKRGPPDLSSNQPSPWTGASYLGSSLTRSSGKPHSSGTHFCFCSGSTDCSCLCCLTYPFLAPVSP